MAIIKITTVTETMYDTETKLSKVLECYTKEEDYSDKPEYKPVIVTKKQSNPTILKEEKKIVKSTKPYIILKESSLQFNQAAVDYMGLRPGVSTIKIKYNTDKKGVVTPIIATTETFGIKTGNKLTKKLTVAFRGMQNQKLSEYGDTFLLGGMPDNTFEMIGNIEKNIPVQIIIPNKEALDNVIKASDEDISYSLENYQTDDEIFEEDFIETSAENSSNLSFEDLSNDPDFAMESELITMSFPEKNPSDDGIMPDSEIFDLDNLEL